MAEKATTTEKKSVKRTDEDLKKTLNGKLTLIVMTAVQLANQNDRAGLIINDSEGKAIDLKAEGGKKELTDKIGLATSPKGTIAGLKETDPNMVALKAAATKALPDLQKDGKGAYSKNIVDLLNFVISTLAVKEKKSRGFDAKRLEGITL